MKPNNKMAGAFPIRLASFVVTALLALPLVTACQHGQVFNSTSMTPDKGNDLTLVMSGCEASLSRGVDICRFQEGSQMQDKLRVLIPWNEAASVSGEMKIRYGSTLRVVYLDSKLYEKTWAEIFEAETWSQEHDGPIQISINMKFMNGAHLESVRLLGYIYILVLSKGYNPLPLNPREPLSTNTCHVTYSAVGQSTLVCE